MASAKNSGPNFERPDRWMDQDHHSPWTYELRDPFLNFLAMSFTIEPEKTRTSRILRPSIKPIAPPKSAIRAPRV